MKLILIALFSLMSVSCVKNIDSGQEVLFKQGYSTQIMEYQSFPMSSWSYVVTSPDYEFSKEQLDILEQDFSVILDKENPRGMNLLLEDWILDGVFLDKPPEDLDRFEDALRASLLKGQFLEMFNHGGLKYIQTDPFGRSERFLNVWSDSFHLNQDKSSAKYKFTPVLPFDSKGVKRKINWKRLEGLFSEGEEGYVIGADFFAKENKAVIMKDLRSVAIAGAVFGILLLCALFYFSLYKVLFFLPVIGIAMWIGTWLLVGISGAIHGLVLSFGTSIVGLSLDYAIHAVHAKDKKRVWYKNLIALGTTLLAFGSLCFSSVPLFQGIALFSIFGLSISFVFMYLFDSKFLFYQKSMGMDLSRFKVSQKWVYIVFAAVILLLPAIKYNKSLKPFMYTPESVRPVMASMASNSSEVLVKITSLKEQDEKVEDKDLKPFSLSSFTGSLSEVSQERNSATWREILESYDVETSNGFFKSYVLKSIERTKETFDFKTRFYASLFLSGDKEISILKIKDDVVREEAKSQGYWSPSALVDEMGGETLKELLTLFGVAFLIAVFALWFVFKKLSKVLKVFFPFTVFILFFFSLSLATSLEVNLIHIIGLLIVFGISLDYGVFGTESTKEEQKETLSSFNLSAISTLLGFTPLVLASHPVLQSLGVVLVTGILGSYIGGLILVMLPRPEGEAPC